MCAELLCVLLGALELQILVLSVKINGRVRGGIQIYKEKVVCTDKSINIQYFSVICERVGSQNVMRISVCL